MQKRSSIGVPLLVAVAVMLALSPASASQDAQRIIDAPMGRPLASLDASMEVAMNRANTADLLINEQNFKEENASICGDGDDDLSDVPFDFRCYCAKMVGLASL